MDHAPSLHRLRVRIFADGADLDQIRTAAGDPLITGFTTNPTLMRKANLDDFGVFARRVLTAVGEKPVSFEVAADSLEAMEGEARAIAGWGPNIYVKIPVTTTAGEFTGALISRLSCDGIPLNVTAVMTPTQVRRVADALHPDGPAIVSVFAGRIADTGRDPVPIMRRAVEVLRRRPAAQLLWASSREVLNVFQADRAGCHIITVTYDLLRKLGAVGRDLDEFSRETVAMLHRDAREAGYAIAPTDPEPVAAACRRAAG